MGKEKYNKALMRLPGFTLRGEFPVLERVIAGHPLAYFDSAATALMPRSVWEAMERFSDYSRANVHRGMHPLAEEATDAYEGARERVRVFLHAAHADEIVFTKGTTESINLVARSLDPLLHEGDAIALTVLEHHSNIVPWQQLAMRRGITIAWIDCNDDGTLNDASLAAALATPKLRLVAVTGMSNVLGTRPHLPGIIAGAHERGAWVLVDAAQLIGHDTVDVVALDCDFLAYSGHKLYGPTGIGVLYGKREILNALPPFLGGGNMVEQVTTAGFTPADAPAKFEAGTPPITEAIGLAAAIEWLTSMPVDTRRAYEHELFAHARHLLSQIRGLRILGAADLGHGGGAEGLLSFIVDGIHPHDLTSVLGAAGICMRAGHHCAQPLHARLGVEASTRLSLALYNTKEELDRLPDALARAMKKLS